MAHYVQIAGQSGHQVAGAVFVIKLHILALKIAVNDRADVGNQPGAGFLTEHDHDVADAGSQQGEADHDGDQRNQQIDLGSNPFGWCENLIDDQSGNRGVDQLQQRHDDNQTHSGDKLLSVPLHIFPDPLDGKHTNHLTFAGKWIGNRAEIHCSKASVAGI